MRGYHDDFSKQEIMETVYIDSGKYMLTKTQFPEFQGSTIKVIYSIITNSGGFCNIKFYDTLIDALSDFKHIFIIYD